MSELKKSDRFRDFWLGAHQKIKKLIVGVGVDFYDRCIVQGTMCNRLAHNFI